VAAIDPDFTTVALSPTHLTWERTWSVCCDALVAGGWDPRYGGRLCGDLRASGLVDVQADYVASCDIGGSVVPPSAVPNARAVARADAGPEGAQQGDRRRATPTGGRHEHDQLPNDLRGTRAAAAWLLNTSSASSSCANRSLQHVPQLRRERWMWRFDRSKNSRPAGPRQFSFGTKAGTSRPGNSSPSVAKAATKSRLPLPADDGQH
jgi:hypothetical protein